MTRTDAHNDAPSRGLASMNGWWAASGMLILLVIIGVIAVLLWGGGTDPAPAAPVTPTTSAPPATSESATTTPTTEASDQQPLTAAPATSWALLYGVAVPTSAEAGPTTKQANVWSGWSRTATGALMAATYLVAATDGPEAQAVMERSAVDVPAARAYISQVKATPKTVAPGTSASIAGFRFATYTPDAARIELSLVVAGVPASIPVDVAWSDGDWKIDFERSGGQPQATRLAGSGPAPGFIPWNAS